MASAEYQEYRRRMVEWEQRQRYARFREKEVAGYNALPPQPTPTLACTPTSPTTATPSQPWWKRTWEGIKQTVDTGLRWIDQHQTEIAIGVGIAAGVAAIALSGGAATPLVAAWVAGSAAVAGGVMAAGTLGLNAYFHRPLTTNLWRNVGYAAGAAVVTSGAGIGGRLLVQKGIIQQGLYAVGNTATRWCLSHPTACSRVDAALILWDKVEDIGLQAKLAIQTARGDPRAAETALELQLEQLDNLPGNTTLREAYQIFVESFRRHSDDIARLGEITLRHSDEVVELTQDGMVYLRRSGEVVNEIAQEMVDATGRKVWVSPSRGVIYVSQPTKDGLEAVAELQTAVKSGADEAIIQALVDEVARASTRGNGERVVLGAWREGGGYIGEAVENGGIFFDTGDEVWEALEASGVDPWRVNEAFLRQQLETGVERIEFVGEDVSALLAKYNRVFTSPYRVREINWLLENAESYGYTRLGNSWVRKTP